MKTSSFFNTSAGNAPIDRSIYNYYYKKNYSGEHMKTPHSHEAAEIEYIIDGNLILEFEDETLKLSKNDIIIIKPNVIHRFLVPKTCKLCKRVNISFSCIKLEHTEFSTFFTDALNTVAGNYLLLGQNPAIQELMEQITRELASHKWGYATIVNADLTALMVLLARGIRKRTVRPSTPNYVQQAKSIMDSSWQEDWTPALIAEQLGISASYLMHIFRSECGITIMKYLEERRLEAARKKLSDTQDSINSIASDTGFSNQQHFSYIFKKNTGLTPSQYRKITQEITYREIDIEKEE